MKFKVNKKYINLLRKNPFLIIAFILIILIIQIEVGILYSIQKSEGNKIVDTTSLASYADTILESCKGANHKPTCYDKTIPKLMDRLSMEQTFEVTKLIQEKDTSYLYCHVLGHELSALEVKKSPDNWKDVLSRCPSGQCSNGCIHGGFQERFRKESFSKDSEIDAIKPDLEAVCEAREDWNPTGLEQASCYHALGHLTMYITNADLKKATALCEEVAIKKDGRDFAQLCYDGAFMQIFQPLEPEDFALIKGKQPQKEDITTFCADFPPAQQGSCISESWPLFREEIQTPEGFINHCSILPDQEKNRCYSVLIYVITPLLDFEEKDINSYCQKLPTTLHEACYTNAASRMIETDYRLINRAVALCSNTPTSTLKTTCFEELLKYSTYNYHIGTDEFRKVCNSLPAPWKEQCLQRENMTL